MRHQDTTGVRSILDALERHMKDTRRAYMAGVAGVEYVDMASAAERVLRMRAAYERAAGRRATTRVTKGAIATLLRAD